MAAITNLAEDSHHTYIPTIALFCGIMCTIAMLKFGGFKASFNLMTGKKRCKERRDKTSDIPVLGAYRSNREEYYGNANKKLTTSMARLPQTNSSKREIRPSKSTSDLLKPNDVPRNSMKNTAYHLSPFDKKQSPTITEKEKISDKKKRDTINEQQKVKKDNHNRNSKNAAIQRPKSEKKNPAPKPPTTELFQTPLPYSSSTLESSISRSSGPPPYSETVPNECDGSGNTSFGKPVHEASSWDLVSQHRQQLNRPVVSAHRKPKSTILDLRYNADRAQQPLQVKDNSEA